MRECAFSHFRGIIAYVIVIDKLPRVHERVPPQKVSRKYFFGRKKAAYTAFFTTLKRWQKSGRISKNASFEQPVEKWSKERQTLEITTCVVLHSMPYCTLLLPILTGSIPTYSRHGPLCFQARAVFSFSFGGRKVADLRVLSNLLFRLSAIPLEDSVTFPNTWV